MRACVPRTKTTVVVALSNAGVVAAAGAGAASTARMSTRTPARRRPIPCQQGHGWTQKIGRGAARTGERSPADARCRGRRRGRAKQHARTPAQHRHDRRCVHAHSIDAAWSDRVGFARGKRRWIRTVVPRSVNVRAVARAGPAAQGSARTPPTTARPSRNMIERLEGEGM